MRECHFECLRMVEGGVKLLVVSAVAPLANMEPKRVQRPRTQTPPHATPRSQPENEGQQYAAECETAGLGIRIGKVIGHDVNCDALASNAQAGEFTLSRRKKLR